MKITAVKAQVKNPERVSIFVDGKYSFSLSLDELLKEKLKKDDELNGADVKRLKKLSADGKLRARAVEWVLNRPRSIREFKDYMYRKKAEAEFAEDLIKQFSDRGYLDEQKFSQWLIELLSRRGKSNRAIRSELFKKGIDREIVEEIMSQEASDEVGRLRTVIAKKRKLPRYRNDLQKIKQYLVAQGFSWDLIKSQLAKNEPEE
ncbi:hypothetical protein A3J32_02870 [Candidatus Saccharibacteria bacterium RIFCSPLOWO2_02_FULL_46_7]|nr:MAG: hypothetical protein A3J32_02870 [Candidatus Saccharibacteria bacterium RIFCSPLOWO2_02_FULL_46_7]